MERVRRRSAGARAREKGGGMAVQEGSGTQASGGSTMEQAKQQVAETTGEARQKAASTLRTQADERSTQAGEQIRSFGQALRRTGEQLREEGSDTPARVAEGVASRVERAGEYLERTDGQTLLSDLEDFGRRQPWLVAAGGMAVGLVASRLLKASSERRSSGRYSQTSQYPQSGLTEQARMTDAPVPATPAEPVSRATYGGV